MAIDLNKYKLQPQDNLQEAKPQSNFMQRLKLGFGGPEAKTKQQQLETEAGLKGKFDVGDIADVAGASLPIIGGIIGGFNPTTPVFGAAAGAAGGQALRRGIGVAIGADQPKVGEVVKDVAYTGAGAYLGGKVLGPALKVVGKGLAKLPINLSSIEAKMMQAYRANVPFWQRIASGFSEKSKAPITAAETAFKQGLIGTESMIGVQAQKAKSKIWSGLIEPNLKQIKEKVNIQRFFKELLDEIKLKNPELARQQDLLNGLNSLKESYKGVKTITFEQLQKIKEGWAKFIPEKTYKGKPISGAFNDVKNEAASKARTLIYDKLGPEIKQAYIDYGNLLRLQELGQKAMTGGKFAGGSFTGLSALKDMLLTPFGTIGGHIIYQAGKLGPFIGLEGARTLKDLFD